MDKNLESDMHLGAVDAGKPVPQDNKVSEANAEMEVEPVREELPFAPPAKKPLGMGKKLLFGVSGLLVLMATLILISGGKRGGSVPSPTSSPGGADLSRYSEDPDEDRVPSFIETKLAGFDPNVSELDNCFNTKCDSVNTEEIKRIPRNVVLLLDSSGSMEQKVGEQTKMEAAKIAIREYLKKTSELPSTKVGLIVYGQKGSNRVEDKEESCQSAEEIRPLGELDLDTEAETLAAVRPVGWTPIGLALRKAQESFVTYNQSLDEDEVPAQVINEVVIISDGVETCDTNPVAVAKELFEGQDKVVVHVIGFAVASTADNQALRDISQAAGGTYATAPTIDELKLAMDLQWDNYVRRAREDACKVRGYETFLACREQKLALVNAYISAELSRDPRELPYEEKLKIDRMRYVFPAYMFGSLDTFAPPSSSPTATTSPSPSPEL